MKKTMKENYNDLKMDVNDLKEMMLKLLIDDGIDSIDTDAFAALQICFKLVKHSEALMESYIEVMEEQDKKLDKILKALETAR